MAHLEASGADVDISNESESGAGFLRSNVLASAFVDNNN